MSKILVVDDERGVLSAFQEMLGAEGYEVLTTQFLSIAPSWHNLCKSIEAKPQRYTPFLKGGRHVQVQAVTRCAFYSMKGKSI